MAVRYSPTHRQAANDHGPAAWGVRNAFASFLPSLSLSGGAGYTGAGSQNLFGGFTYELPSGSVGSSYNLRLNMQLNGQTLMQPGLALAQLRAADATAESSEINLESSVRQQYLAVLRAEAQSDAAGVQVTRNEEFQRLAQARYDVGQNTMLDVRQAEVTLGQARVALLQAEQLVTVEKLRLFQLMGVPGPGDPTGIVLSDTFPIVQPEWELAALLGDAEEFNPDLRSLRAQQSSAAANERAVKSNWLPSFSLSAGWSGYTQQYTDASWYIDQQVEREQASVASNLETCNFRNDIIDGLGLSYSTIDCAAAIEPWTPERADALREWYSDQQSVFPFSFTRQPFSASIGFSFPIFTQFSRPLQISQASAQAEDAKEYVRARELDVRTAVTQAYYGMLAAHETIEIQEQNQTAASEGLRLATERYRVGSGTFFELLDAQLAAQNAERDYINAIYGYHQAIATLEAAVGRPLR
jgi:outer membrane protein